MTIRTLLALTIRALAMLAPLAVVASVPASAADKTIELSALQVMVANLGYEDTGDKKDNIIIGNVNSTDYAITMRVRGDKAGILIDIPFASIPKDKMAMLPASKMLNYNDIGDFYFAFSTDNDGLYFPELQKQIGAAEVTPQLLRATMDQMVTTANDTKDLWDAGKWTGPGSAKPK